MSARRFDPEKAAASTALLASVSDEQLAVMVRDALVELAPPVMALARTGTWPVSDFDARAVEAFNAAQRVVAGLSGEPPSLDAVVRAAQPALGMWWSGGSAEAVAVQDAVERLRYAAMVLPSLVENARGIEATHRALRHGLP